VEAKLQVGGRRYAPAGVVLQYLEEGNRLSSGDSGDPEGKSSAEGSGKGTAWHLRSVHDSELERTCSSRDLREQAGSSDRTE
jgi:hypothetical protein